MKLFRARAWRDPHARLTFDPLDSGDSIRGPLGWRWNDTGTEILYAADCAALATLEVAIRPGLETIRQILVATLEIPDGRIVNPADVGIVLPSNWNARPVANDSRLIAREFLRSIAALPAASRPLGLRVPSVLSATDYNVLLDTTQRAQYHAAITDRVPFATLRGAGS